MSVVAAIAISCDGCINETLLLQLPKGEVVSNRIPVALHDSLRQFGWSIVAHAGAGAEAGAGQRYYCGLCTDERRRDDDV